jgi:cation transport protein ChaC
MVDRTPPASSPSPDAKHLGREDFNEARVRAFAAIAARAGFSVTTQAERDASLAAILASHPAEQDLWIFGYGSLMWNPALEVSESRPATVFGFHRRFCLDQQFGRGSPECPGIMLALDSGGCCNGVAHRIAAANIESEMRILWLREMPSGAYHPKWTRARTPSGQVRAITFVINREHPRYLGRLPVEVVVDRLAFAEGQSGTNFDYLEKTVASMGEKSIRDRSVAALLHRVRQRRTEMPGPRTRDGEAP